MRTVVTHAERYIIWMSNLNRVEGNSSSITVMSLDYRTCCDWRECARAVAESCELSDGAYSVRAAKSIAPRDPFALVQNLEFLLLQ
jgi:hypothetical protein